MLTTLYHVFPYHTTLCIRNLLPGIIQFTTELEKRAIDLLTTKNLF